MTWHHDGWSSPPEQMMTKKNALPVTSGADAPTISLYPNNTFDQRRRLYVCSKYSLNRVNTL